MFKPKLKDTGWRVTPEVIFEITGENYQESSRLYRKYYEVEEVDGTKTTLNDPACEYNRDEIVVSTIINDSLINIVWDSLTISELEKYFKEAISEEGSQLRLELDEDCVFGWFHYKRKNKTNTFRFKIDLKGGFSKC